LSAKKITPNPYGLRATLQALAMAVVATTAILWKVVGSFLFAFRAFNLCGILSPSCVSDSLYRLATMLAVKLYFSFVDCRLFVVVHCLAPSCGYPLQPDKTIIADKSG
jgi:hypothetical protein